MARTGSALTALLLVGIGGIATGLAAGYYLFSSAPEAEVIEAIAPVQPVIEPIETQAVEVSPFDAQVDAINALMAGGLYEDAIFLIENLELLAESGSEISRVQMLMAGAVQARVEQLMASQQFGEIDALYERLTLRMPERAEYYLALGEFRIKYLDPETALPVLAQIENHHSLGRRARELIETVLAETELPPIAAIPLRRMGNQFVVSVRLDGRRSAALMIDTGASTSVVDPSILQDLGYDLGGRMTRFSTAGGVVLAPMISIRSLAVGDKVIEPIVVGALNLDSGQRKSENGVDGLLGMDFLRHFEFSIDQQQAVLNLLSVRRLR